MSDTRLEPPDLDAKPPKVITAKRKPHRTQWSIRSLLIGMTIIGVQLALFRVSPFIGVVVLLFFMPTLLMAGLRRVFGFEKSTIRGIAKIWSCLLFLGIPTASALYSGYSEFPPQVVFWMLLQLLGSIALPGTFVAVFHYFITIVLFDLMEEALGLIRISRRHYQKALPAKQITIKMMAAGSATISQIP